MTARRSTSVNRRHASVRQHRAEPRTAVGLARSKQADWKHGRFSAAARQEMVPYQELFWECKEMAELGSCRKRDLGLVVS